MTVAELSVRMSASEAAEWAAFREFEAEMATPKEERKAVDWREMKDRFDAIKKRQAETGSRTLVKR